MKTKCIIGLIVATLLSGCASSKEHQQALKAYYEQDSSVTTFKMTGITKIEGTNICIEASQPREWASAPKSDAEVIVDGVVKVAPFLSMFGVVASAPSAADPVIVEQPSPIIVQPSYAPTK